MLFFLKLDGAILDHEILHLLESQVKKIFQKFQVEQFQFLNVHAGRAFCWCYIPEHACMSRAAMMGTSKVLICLLFVV